LIPPARFIAAAESMGLIVPIGRWVLAAACRQIKLWQARYPAQPPLFVSVNVSPKQFSHSSLVNDIQAALHDSDLDPAFLQLEITETTAMTDTALTTAVLDHLKHLGVRITVDDFGTGHSSLGRLRIFPVNFLKIDRSFVETIMADRSSLDIIRLVISLAHSMKIQVVAEGIETLSQANHLKALGCEFGQGFLYSPALPENEAEALLSSSLGMPLPESAHPASRQHRSGA
jgi:EAL domain-containing protein (putative c-di-GMP-specific phosphodiesterase class I)